MYRDSLFIIYREGHLRKHIALHAFVHDVSTMVLKRGRTTHNIGVWGLIRTINRGKRISCSHKARTDYLLKKVM